MGVFGAERTRQPAMRESWRAAAIAIAFLAGAQSPTLPQRELRPTRTLDLRSVGYEFPGLPSARIGYRILTNKLAFIDNDILAVSLFVSNPSPEMSVREKVFGGQYLFETAFFDAKSGKPLRKQTWSNAGRGAGLFPAPGGGFVVWHDLDLSSYAADGTMLKTLALDPKDFPRAVSIHQSPSGEMLFALTLGRGVRVRRITTRDLSQLGWLDFVPGFLHGAGSEEYFAFTRQSSPPPYPPRIDVFIVDLSGDETSMREPKRIFATSSPGCENISFLDEDTLGLSGSCHALTLIKASGAVLYQHRFDKEFAGDVIGCQDCGLVLSSTYILGGGGEWRETFPTAKNRKIVLIDGKSGDLRQYPTGPTAKQVSALSISPNGCRFAEQTDARLDIYDICAPQTGAGRGTN